MAQPYQRPGSAFPTPQQAQYATPGNMQGQVPPPSGHYQQPSGGPTPSIIPTNNPQNPPPPLGQWSQAPPAQPGWQAGHPTSGPPSQPQPPMPHHNQSAYGPVSGGGQIPVNQGQAGPSNTMPNQAYQQGAYGNQQQQQQYQQPQPQQQQQHPQAPQAPRNSQPPQPQAFQQQHQRQQPQPQQQPPYLQQQPLQQPQPQAQQQTLYRPLNPAYAVPTPPVQASGPSQARPPSVSQASPAQANPAFQAPGQRHTPQQSNAPYNVPPPQQQGTPFSQQAPPQHPYGQPDQVAGQYQGSSSQLGPTPPPVPPNYQHGAIVGQPGQPPQPQYSHQPPSHHYGPQSQHQASAMQPPQPQGMPNPQASGPYPQNASIPPQNQFGQPASSQGQYPQAPQSNAPPFPAPHLQGLNQGQSSQGAPQQPQQQPVLRRQQLQSQPPGQYGMALPMPVNSPPLEQPSPWSAATPQASAGYQGSNPSPQIGQFSAGPPPTDGRPPGAQQYQQPQTPERKKFTYIPPGTKPLQQQVQDVFSPSQMTSGQAFNQQPQIQQPPSWAAQHQLPQGQQQPPSANNQWQPVPTPPSVAAAPAFAPAQSHNPMPNQPNMVQSPQTFQQPQPGSNGGNWQGQGGMINQPGEGQNQGWDQRKSNHGTSTDSAEYQHIHQDGGSHLPTNGVAPVQDAPTQTQHSSHESQVQSQQPVLAVQSDLEDARLESPQPIREGHGMSQTAAQESKNIDEPSKIAPSPTMSPSVLGASALGGALGPSDWEHFGVYDSDEDIDDTETFGAKDDTAKPVSNNALNVTAELPSAPSPPPKPALQRHSSSRISSEPDIWPTPPMPAPLQPNRPVSTAESIEHVPTPPLNHTHYAPTPPPKNELPWGSPGRAASVISFDAPSAPSSRPTNLASSLHQPQPLSQNAYAARDSFLSDDAISHKSFNINDNNISQPIRDERSGPGFGAISEEPARTGELNSAVKRQGINPESDRSIDTHQEQTGNPTASQPSTQSLPAPIQQNMPPPAALKNVAMDRSTQTAMEEPESHDKVPVDPYAHLDPWYRDSLSRFANALQQEREADSDQDRKKVFTEFMIAESSLRGISYNTGSNSPERDHDERREVTAAGVPSTPLPIETTSNTVKNDDDYSPGGRPRKRASITAWEQIASTTQVVVPSQPNRALSYRKPIRAYSIPIQSNSMTLPHSIPESSANDARIPVDQGDLARSSTDDAPRRPEIHHVGSSESQKYKAYTPPVILESTSSQNLDLPNFKDSENPEEEFPDFMDNSTRKPSVPVSAQSPTKVTGSSFGPGKKVRSMTARGEHEETFIDPPVHEEKVGEKKSDPVISSKQLPMKRVDDDLGNEDVNGQNPGQTRDTIEEDEDSSRRVESDKLHKLDTSEPSPRKTQSSSQAPLPSVDFPSILPLRSQGQNQAPNPTKRITESLSSLLEDSPFAKNAAAAWETRSKATRDQHDKERQIRQEEQEEQTDRLFSENQISYSDIPELEEEFKRSETDRKAQEEKAEYEGFVREVFEPVYNQFQADIKLLKSLEAQCFDFMINAVAGKKALESSNSNARLLDCMEIFLGLHNKIELRHSRVLEAILDRNKRYKRTVVQPLYAAGNIPKMKQMEKHFDESEKKAALEASQEKLARAKRLMETVEQGTMRGIGENLDYMEEITQAIQQMEQKVSSVRDGRYLGQPQAACQGVIYAQEVMQQLTESSHTLLKSFHTAAQAVNYSTYDVGAVSAKLSNADGTELERILKAEQDEGKRLDEDLKHRLSVVGSDLETTREQARKLLLELKKLGPAMLPETMVIPPTPVMAPPSQDLEHQKRIQRALEAAKKRNSAIA